MFLHQIPDLDLLISGADIIGIGTTISASSYITLDGYIGSGQIFFQRNSFDADRLYKTITIKPPSISTSTLNIRTGTYRSLITLTGENLNYVTGIRFEGVGGQFAATNRIFRLAFLQFSNFTVFVRQIPINYCLVKLDIINSLYFSFAFIIQERDVRYMS